MYVLWMYVCMYVCMDLWIMDVCVYNCKRVVEVEVWYNKQHLDLACAISIPIPTIYHI